MFPKPPPAGVKFLYPATVVVVTLLSLLVANWLLLRVRSGQFFLFALPFDRWASTSEQMDAIHSVNIWRWPALGAILVLGGLAIALQPRWTGARPERNLFLWNVLLIVSAIADLVSTLWFLHRSSIELEVHPGIRLFAYAFGRTAGPVLAKGLQLSGIYIAGRLWPQWRALMYALAALAMSVATAHNVLNIF
ncbi:hypothetical protein SH661x_000244 [Planctomicrobium sp. SH661]|uniref:hypothetical protein n=1 Tax=Planctomicrobium sp. SH661 TaxID=3448124 RepID=UPI003F5C688E